MSQLEDLTDFLTIQTQVLQPFRKKVAECASLYSSPSLRAIYKTPMEAIALLIAVTNLLPARKEYIKYKLKEEMAARCFKNNYQGKWSIVQEFLELKNDYLWQQFELLQQHFSNQDIFGNIIQLTKKIVPTIRIIDYRPDRRPVRKPQRRRGYNDKGTLRFSHERHSAWTWTGENPVRVDRRDKVSAPSRPILWNYNKKRK